MEESYSLPKVMQSGHMLSTLVNLDSNWSEIKEDGVRLMEDGLVISLLVNVSFQSDLQVNVCSFQLSIVELLPNGCMEQST